MKLARSWALFIICCRHGCQKLQISPVSLFSLSCYLRAFLRSMPWVEPASRSSFSCHLFLLQGNPGAAVLTGKGEAVQNHKIKPQSSGRLGLLCCDLYQCFLDFPLLPQVIQKSQGGPESEKCPFPRWYKTLLKSVPLESRPLLQGMFLEISQQLLSSSCQKKQSIFQSIFLDSSP